MSISPEANWRTRYDCENPINKALKIANSVPILSPEESIQLGESIVEFRNVLGPNVAKMDEPQGSCTIPAELKNVYSYYREEVNKLVSGNLHLVAVVYKLHPSLLSLPEQLQEDLIATAWGKYLFIAAERYNPWFALNPYETKYQDRQPGRFSTYAVRVMWGGMLKTIKSSCDPHIPEWRWKQYRRFLEARDLCSENGVSGFKSVVATAEIMQNGKQRLNPTDISEYVKSLEEREANSQKPQKVISYGKLLRIMNPLSLEELSFGKKQYREEESGELEQVRYSLENVLPSQSNTEDEATKKVLQETIKKVLENTEWKNPRVKQILELRFLSNPPYTLEQLAQFFGVTKERIRDIEARGLILLRRADAHHQLRDFLD